MELFPPPPLPAPTGLGGQPELARRFGGAAVLLDVALAGLPGKAARKQCAQFIADFVPQRPRPRGQPQGHGELAVAKLDLVDLLELHGAAAGFGILEAGKGVADGGLGDGWGHYQRFLGETADATYRTYGIV